MHMHKFLDKLTYDGVQQGSIGLQVGIATALNAREINKHEILDSMSTLTAGCNLDSIYGTKVMLLLQVSSAVIVATTATARAHRGRPQLECSAHRLLRVSIRRNQSENEASASHPLAPLRLVLSHIIGLHSTFS
jgi:hypothetical protein